MCTNFGVSHSNIIIKLLLLLLLSDTKMYCGPSSSVSIATD